MNHEGPKTTADEAIRGSSNASNFKANNSAQPARPNTLASIAKLFQEVMELKVDPIEFYHLKFICLYQPQCKQFGNESKHPSEQDTHQEGDAPRRGTHQEGDVPSNGIDVTGMAGRERLQRIQDAAQITLLQHVCSQYPWQPTRSAISNSPFI